MEAWHEQDEFWAKWAPYLFPEGRWEQTDSEVTSLVSLLGIAPGDSILDLCCGPGRHSLELARRGFSVTGVDRTESYLEQARGRAAGEGLGAEFIGDDMRTFCRPETYDAVVSLFTSFGYFEDIDQDRQVATNVYRSLRDGGAFLIDLMGKEVLARIFREREWFEVDDMLVLHEHRMSADWGWLENRWIMIRDGRREEHTVSHRIYSAVELSALLRGCGFDDVEVYGNLSRVPYDHRAWRLVVVAHKGSHHA
ncbi:MAG: class I SAM-dependent methyltransferase [Chloroflexota bacterium]|nr:class I SAM-dependent methyltransferase [Chloroflexota bacterium]